MLLGRIAARDNDTLADVSLNVPRIGRQACPGDLKCHTMGRLDRSR
jgi:hypothetical protein